MFTALYNTDDNCLVAAPTGSGKTACAEFAVLRMVQRASEGACAARCVYIAPVPALARERLADWRAKVRARGCARGAAWAWRVGVGLGLERLSPMWACASPVGCESGYASGLGECVRRGFFLPASKGRWRAWEHARSARQ